MKTPRVLVPTRIPSIAFALAVCLAAPMAFAADPVAAVAAELEPAIAEPADAALLEALSLQQAKLEQELEAKLAIRFDALSERMLENSIGSLAAAHDARLLRRIQMGARIEQGLVSLSRTPSNEYDAFATDRAEMIVHSTIPAHGLIE